MNYFEAAECLLFANWMMLSARCFIEKDEVLIHFEFLISGVIYRIIGKQIFLPEWMGSAV